MSYQATRWARDQRTGSPTAKAVLLILAEEARADDPAGCSFLSHATIAERAELKRRATVVAALATLEAQGLISRERRNDGRGHRTTDLVRLNMAETQSAGDAPRDDSQSAPAAPRTPPKVRETARLSALRVQERGSEKGRTEREARFANARPIPEGFPWEENIARERAFLEAKGWNIDADLEAEKFRAHAQANGRTCRDWRAAFHGWVAKAIEFASPQQRRAPIVADHPPAQTVPPEAWRQRVRAFAAPADPRDKRWNPDWGAKPGQPGCAAPALILAEFGLHLAPVAGAEGAA